MDRVGPRIDNDSGVGRHASIGHRALPRLELGVDFGVCSRVLGGRKADESGSEWEGANHVCGVSGEGNEWVRCRVPESVPQEEENMVLILN